MENLGYSLQYSITDTGVTKHIALANHEHVIQLPPFFLPIFLKGSFIPNLDVRSCDIILRSTVTCSR